MSLAVERLRDRGYVELADYVAEQERKAACFDELLAAIYLALPFVEDCLGSTDFKAGVVKRHVKTLRAAIDNAEKATS